MLNYLINRYKFVYGEVFPEEKFQKYLHLAQLYSYIILGEPLVENMEQVTSFNLSDGQMYILNYVIEEYRYIKGVYSEVDLLDFDYFKSKSTELTVVDPIWEW